MKFFSEFTLNDGQQNDDNKEEESDVEYNTIHLVVIAIWISYLISYTSSSSHSLVEMEHETLKRQSDEDKLNNSLFILKIQ
jgi:hypothetical protein